MSETTSDPVTVQAFRGPWVDTLVHARRASVFAGPSFARRVNEAVDADPSLWTGAAPTHWSRMNLHSIEQRRAPTTETTCRRYAAGLGDFEAFVVLVPKGAKQVLVEIHDSPEDVR